jgi:hypothetical protein
MTAPWTPMRWPDGWKDPATLALLKGTAIDHLLIGNGPELSAVKSRAAQDGFHVSQPGAPPAGVEIVKGQWPGVKMERGGGASAGPTGNPWVDSNGWAIRLAAALHPETAVWVDAAPAGNAFITAGSYLIAVADSAAYGGRWIVSLDKPLAVALAAGKSDALATWRRLTATAGFFAAHKAWPGYVPMAVVGVVSDFTGDNEFFSQELLNLLARAGQHCRILPKDRITDASLVSLRAAIYADAEPPAPALRKQILAFVAAGGMLVTVPKWGEVPGTPIKNDGNPRYSLRALGKGTVAVAVAGSDDPYLWANESVVMVSHRYDLVRFWNSGAAGSFCTVAPDGKQAVVHLLFYANRGPDSATVRIAGRYRAARVYTVDNPAATKVEWAAQTDAVEIHLPPVSQYVALELDI